jgi:protein-disulfide isomerase
VRSSSPPAIADGDRVRGEGPADVIEYGDYECPYCAQADLILAGLPVRRAFRHFPVTSKHPRARVLASAVEAAALQGAFWEMHDALFADQGRLDDPHLWERVRRLDLDLDRFEADRRSEAVAARVGQDFRSGVAAGVMSTPTLFVDGAAHPGVPGEELIALLRAAAPRC